MVNTHFKKHLIHQCTRQRVTPVQSASGEPIYDWDSATEVTIDCRFVEKEEAIADSTQGLMMAQQVLMLVNAGEDIAEEDRIVDVTLKSDGSTVDAGPFTIEGMNRRSSTKPHHISLNLERIE